MKFSQEKMKGDSIIPLTVNSTCLCEKKANNDIFMTRRELADG